MAAPSGNAAPVPETLLAIVSETGTSRFDASLPSVTSREGLAAVLQKGARPHARSPQTQRWSFADVLEGYRRRAPTRGLLNLRSVAFFAALPERPGSSARTGASDPPR